MHSFLRYVSYKRFIVMIKWSPFFYASMPLMNINLIFLTCNIHVNPKLPSFPSLGCAGDSKGKNLLNGSTTLLASYYKIISLRKIFDRSDTLFLH